MNAEAHSMQERADAHFERGVFAPDAAHIPGTAFGCEAVAHPGSNLTEGNGGDEGGFLTANEREGTRIYRTMRIKPVARDEVAYPALSCTYSCSNVGRSRRLMLDGEASNQSRPNPTPTKRARPVRELARFGPEFLRQGSSRCAH